MQRVHLKVSEPRLTRRIARWAIAAFALVFIASCASPPKEPVNLTPPAEEAAPVVAAPPEPDAAITQRGTGAFAAAPKQPVLRQSGDTRPIDFAFDSVPVGLAVQTLLTDYAGTNVIVDPRVRGDISLRSRATLTANDLPDYLANAVKPLGLELVQQGENTFLLRPAPTGEDATVAPSLYSRDRPIPAGGVIVPLKFVSAAEMARLIAPYAKGGVTVTPEPTREYLLLTGPPGQVEAVTRTIELLDVDWLAGMSMALVPLEASEPDAIIAELETLFGGKNGPIGSMVEFVPMKSRQAILVLAKRPDRLDQARTWIMQLDRAERGRFSRMQVIPVSNNEAGKLAQTLQTLLDKDASAKINADESRNALIVQADASTMASIKSLVAELDRPSDQVVIEATIAEVTLNDDLKFGVQWFFDTRNGGTATFSEASNGAVTSRFPGFSYGFTSSYVKASLNALASKTNVEIISSPVIVTLDNREATLQVGDEVPIVTQSAVNVTTAQAPAIVNSVQYRDTGIVLKVTPRIGTDNRVTLEISQEASLVTPTTTSGIDSPTIQQRKFESTVLVADGETVALGGLIRASRARGNSGLPFIKDVPLVGAAFKTSTKDIKRTELLVYLTPRIIRTKEDATDATQDLRDRLERIRKSSFIERYALAR